MAKELPYFQFEPAEYLTKDISFCSLEAQGLFINICSYYWQRSCKLTKQQLLRRLDYPSILDELITEGIVDLIEDTIIIKFLDDQLLKATKTSNTNSINGKKGGRPPKEKPNKTEVKPNLNRNETEIQTETKGIREDNIIKEKKIKNKEFFNSCLTSDAWLEQIAMKTKCKKSYVVKLLNEFNDDLCLKEDYKHNLKDFKTHFVNWFNIKSKESRPNPFKNEVF
jgi:hypothetical protein